jgi:hypothetical protein
MPRRVKKTVRFPEPWWATLATIGALTGKSRNEVLMDLIEDSLKRKYPNLTETLMKTYDRNDRTSIQP